MFRILYSFLGYLLLPFILLRLLWRSRKLPLYRKHILQRFGFFYMPKEYKHGIWIHAVSMGEVLVATPLTKALQASYPQMPIVITTMTATGSQQVSKNFANEVFHIYVPYDLPSLVKRFLKKIKPRLAIFIETELWPNTLYYCHKYGIPTMIANARLSERSARGYAKFPGIVKDLLQNVTCVAVQTEEEAKRFIQLGLLTERKIVTGSIKFDIQLSESVKEQAKKIREKIGQDRVVWIAASTHEGEEEQILAAFHLVQQKIKDCLLILVPRHPERFDKVAMLCEKQKFKIARRSKSQTCVSETAIYLGDTMGELLSFYGASDIAFVGGSLIERGGHNLLEPAAFNVPVLTGPHLFNFTKIADLLKKAGALIVVENVQQLADSVIKLLKNKTYHQEIAAAGQKVIAANRGALQKHVEVIEKLLMR